MSEIAERPKPISWLRVAVAVALIGTLAGLLVFPERVWATAQFVLWGLIEVAPLVVPGILLAAWVSASGAGDRIAEVFNGRVLHTVVIASLIGAITPVCGVTVLPLMAVIPRNNR